MSMPTFPDDVEGDMLGVKSRFDDEQPSEWVTLKSRNTSTSNLRRDRRRPVTHSLGSGIKSQIYSKRPASLACSEQDTPRAGGMHGLSVGRSTSTMGMRGYTRVYGAPSQAPNIQYGTKLSVLWFTRHHGPFVYSSYCHSCPRFSRRRRC